MPSLIKAKIDTTGKENKVIIQLRFGYTFVRAVSFSIGWGRCGTLEKVMTARLLDKKEVLLILSLKYIKMA